jgi:hypothetical protein
MTIAMQFALLACAAAAAAAQPEGPTSLNYSLRFVDLSAHPLAVCNDGSPAAYYVHRRTDEQWVLHQQGGWWCWDDFSCQTRWNHFANHTTELRTLMSTKDLAAITAAHDRFNGEINTGILSHNVSNPMAEASKVFVVYCSSDAHAGNRSAGAVPRAGTSKWHFRGKEIVRAILEELGASHGLSSARSVVLTGGSAGGMATVNNADWVRSLLGEIAPQAEMVAMPDSGYFLDVMPRALCDKPGTYECLCAAGPTAPDATLSDDGWNRKDGHAWLGPGQTLAQQMQAMLVFTQGLVDRSCAEHYGKYGAWRCYLGQYAAPFLETRSLFLQSQIDEWQGFWNGFFDYATDAHGYEYAGWFRNETRRLLRHSTMARAEGPGPVFGFAPNCYHHGLSYDSRFWEVQAGGFSSATALSALLQRARLPALVADECKGLPCGPQTHGFPECQPVAPPHPIGIAPSRIRAGRLAGANQDPL